MMHRALGLLLSVSYCAPAALAEDGYDLWLRYRPLGEEARLALAPRISSIVGPDNPSTTVRAAIAELQNGLSGLLATDVPAGSTPVAGAILLGTPATVAAVADLRLPLNQLGDEGYLIRSATIDDHPATVIAAQRVAGGWVRTASAAARPGRSARRVHSAGDRANPAGRSGAAAESAGRLAVGVSRGRAVLDGAGCLRGVAG